MGLIKEDMSYLQLFADFLSLITISSCLILKIPQILQLVRVKNTKGMNLIGLLMELSSYTITLCYNYRNGYAILSYMEYPIILAQEIVLIYVVLYYMNAVNVKSAAWSVMYFSIFGGFFFGILPREFLSFLVPLCTPVGASSKVVQLYEIIRSKDADSVSLLTWFISAFTNSTRIFTIFMDSADALLLLNFIVSTFLSSSIMVTAYYYQTRPKKHSD